MLFFLVLPEPAGRYVLRRRRDRSLACSDAVLDRLVDVTVPGLLDRMVDVTVLGLVGGAPALGGDYSIVG